MKTIFFDTATGKRIYRRAVGRLAARVVTRTTALWAAEVVGVIAIAAGAWMAYAPLGLVIVGLYLVAAANSQDG